MLQVNNLGPLLILRKTRQFFEIFIGFGVCCLFSVSACTATISNVGLIMIIEPENNQCLKCGLFKISELYLYPGKRSTFME